jgi:hypothetical protein
MARCRPPLVVARGHKEVKMGTSKYQVEAIFREFPWLEKIPVYVEHGIYLNVNNVGNAEIRHVTPELLELYPEHIGPGALNLVKDSFERKIFLLNKEGKILTEVGPTYRRIGTKNPFSNETVGEALGRIQSHDEVCYVVQIIGEMGASGYEITLFKPPKGWILKNWVEEKRDRAKKVLQAHLDGIDLEGIKNVHTLSVYLYPEHTTNINVYVLRVLSQFTQLCCDDYDVPPWTDFIDAVSENNFEAAKEHAVTFARKVVSLNRNLRDYECAKIRRDEDSVRFILLGKTEVIFKRDSVTIKFDGAANINMVGRILSSICFEMLGDPKVSVNGGEYLPVYDVLKWLVTLL